ncbi:MAG: flagellar biosynthesis protein FlhB [Alphaproteobacteria bacterium]|nr:flagellar biosynthesis protein FlhB [Alphaproteobacteria bacterium]
MAEGDDDDQKTEAPSSRRLDEARERGQLPISRETTAWIILLGILVTMAWLIPPLMIRLAGIMRVFLESPDQFAMDDGNMQALMFHTLGQVALASGTAFFILMLAIIGGVMIQTGFFFAPDLLEFDLMRLNPAAGFKRLFSMQAVVDLGKSVGKMLFLGGIAFGVLMPIAYESPSMTGMPLPAILDFLQHKVVYLLAMLLLGFTLIAAFDLFYTRYSYMKSLRMTKTEVKDEFKQMEGDPMIKSRLRQIRAEKARKRMMSQVPKADVVITNPTHYAVALQYDGGTMSAPVVLAKGINLIAERIRSVAGENRIPIVSNPPLARALYDGVEINQQIPGQHYRAVAEIISYVYKLRKLRR